MFFEIPLKFQEIIEYDFRKDLIFPLIFFSFLGFTPNLQNNNNKWQLKKYKFKTISDYHMRHIFLFLKILYIIIILNFNLFLKKLRSQIKNAFK